LGRGDAARIAAAAAASLLLGWWVVKTSAVDGIVGRSPAAAAAVAPSHPEVRLALAAGGLDLGTGTVPPEQQRAAAAALASAPLADEPFLLAGLSAISAGRAAEGEALLEEARRRNPRLRPARLFLLDRYLREGKIEEAGIELAALRRLVPGVAEALAPQLARLVRDERSGADLIRVLNRDPHVQQAVLSQLATSGADPDLILRIARASRMTPTRDGLPWQRLLLQALIERGDTARAVRLWRSFAGLPAGPDDKAVHDGRFQGLPGAAPFNWSLSSGNAGTAERGPGPALHVEYFGRETVDLAQQLMALRPGRYRLQFRVEGNAKGDDSRLSWRVVCTGSNAEIAGIVVRDVTAAPRALGGEFAVPVNCSTQSLRLSGIAGEFPGTQIAAISDLQIVPAGSR
jgi:hypothetical protein